MKYEIGEIMFKLIDFIVACTRYNISIIKVIFNVYVSYCIVTKKLKKTVNVNSWVGRTFF